MHNKNIYLIEFKFADDSVLPKTLWIHWKIVYCASVYPVIDKFGHRNECRVKRVSSIMEIPMPESLPTLEIE